MIRIYGIPTLAAVIFIASSGCGDSATSFRSVPGNGDNQPSGNAAANADATAEQPAGATDGSPEGSNGNDADAGATTVVLGPEGAASEVPDSSVMTVSIDGGSGSDPSATDIEPSGTDTAANTDPSSTGTEVVGTTPATDSAASTTTANTSTESYEPVVTLDDNKYRSKVSGDCAALSDAPITKIKVVSAKNTGAITVKSDEILLIHASGNKPIVKIKTANGENAKVKGICIFAAGNQTKVEAVFGINVGIFSYVGTGNMSIGSVTVNENVAIDLIKVRLRGNQAKLTVSGEGNYQCGTPDLGGHGSQFNCK